jgi:hypothetical protein
MAASNTQYLYQHRFWLCSYPANVLDMKRLATSYSCPQVRPPACRYYAGGSRANIHAPCFTVPTIQLFTPSHIIEIVACCKDRPPPPPPQVALAAAATPAVVGACKCAFQTSKCPEDVVYSIGYHNTSPPTATAAPPQELLAAAVGAGKRPELPLLQLSAPALAALLAEAALRWELHAGAPSNARLWGSERPRHASG